MQKLFLAFLAAGLLLSCKNEKEEAEKNASENASMVKSAATVAPQAEMGDKLYADMGAQMLRNLAEGKMEEWAAGYADDAKYYWCGGDSLIGKAAIVDYWRNRRTNVIQSINVSNDIWLPVKVNQTQKGPDRVGTWVMGWFQFNSTYKNGKSVGGWQHVTHHLNDAGKVDQTVVYMDRAPINAALGMK